MDVEGYHLIYGLILWSAHGTEKNHEALNQNNGLQAEVWN
jgi:hypothetical protein